MLNRQRSTCEYDLKIDDRLEARLLALSCSAPPEGQVRWSLRLLAKPDDEPARACGHGDC